MIVRLKPLDANDLNEQVVAARSWIGKVNEQNQDLGQALFSL